MRRFLCRRLAPAAFAFLTVVHPAGVTAATSPPRGAGGADDALTITVTPDQGAAGIAQALRRVREMRRSHSPPQAAVRVLLAPGEYALDQPLSLTADDSGTEAAPLVIEARTRDTVWLTGAPRLQLQQAGNGIWRFAGARPLDRAAERSGGQLFVNDRRAVLARQPKAGAAWLVDKADRSTLFATAQDAATIARLAGADADRAIVVLMQSWTSGRHHIAGFDGATNGFRLAPDPRWSFLQYGPKQRYHVENLPRAWTSPGEWIAADGALQYRPLPADGSGTEAARRASAYWPREPRLLVIRGDAGRPVRHVQLRNLAFAYTGQPTPDEGWADNQSASRLPAAIEVDDAIGLRLLDCSVRHTGASAVWLRQGVRDAEISGSVFDDLGGGAIKIGTEQTLAEPDRTAGNRIVDNVITRVGREFYGAIGVWIGRSFGNEVRSNLIAQTSYTAISVGWSWGYEQPTAGDNRIVDNALIDIGQGTLSDLGGIYTLGRQPGTVVSGNFIRRVEAFPDYGAGGWGIYNDEGSEGILVENNVVIGTRSGGYQLHYGRDLTVRDNFFAGGRTAEIRWANVKRSGDWRFENNGVEPSAGRGTFEYHNDDGSSGARTLQQLKSNQGFDAVLSGSITPGVASAGSAADGPTNGSSQRLATWRRVVSQARALVERARTAGWLRAFELQGLAAP